MDLRPFEAFALDSSLAPQPRAASALGASQSTWYRAIDRGVFEPVHPNVVRMIGSPQTPPAADPRRGLGRRATARSRRIAPAALLWGVERPADDPVDIILPATNTPGRRSTASWLHRPRDLQRAAPGDPPGHPVRRRRCGCSSTSARSIAARRRPRPRRRADAARSLSFGAVVAGLKRHAKRGHTGIGALRAALDAVADRRAVPPTASSSSR